MSVWAYSTEEADERMTDTTRPVTPKRQRPTRPTASTQKMVSPRFSVGTAPPAVLGAHHKFWKWGRHSDLPPPEPDAAGPPAEATPPPAADAAEFVVAFVLLLS